MESASGMNNTPSPYHDPSDSRQNFIPPPRLGDGDKVGEYLESTWQGLPWCPKQYEPAKLSLEVTLKMCELTRACIAKNIAPNTLWHPTNGLLTMAVCATKPGCLTPEAIDVVLGNLPPTKEETTMRVAPDSPQHRWARPPSSSLTASPQETPVPPLKSWIKTSEPTASIRSSTTAARPPIIPSKRKHVDDHDTTDASMLPTSQHFHTATLPSQGSRPASSASQAPQPYSTNSTDVDDIAYLSRVWGEDPWVPTEYRFSGGAGARELRVMRQITEVLVSHNFPLGSIWELDSEHYRGVQGLMMRCMKRKGMSRMNYDVAIDALDELRYILKEADRIKQNFGVQVLVRRPSVSSSNQRTTFVEKSSSIHKSPVDKTAVVDLEVKTSRENSLRFQGPRAESVAVAPPPPLLSQSRQPMTRQTSVESIPVVLSPTEAVTEDLVTMESPRRSCVSDFDSALYSQPGVFPPPGVDIPEIKPFHEQTPEYVVHSGPSDPRLYFCHLVDRSKEWYEQKQAEIRARRGRKANFGKATQRLSKQLREGFTPKPLDDFIWVHTLLPETRADRNLLSVMRMVRRLNQQAAVSEAGTTNRDKVEKTTVETEDPQKAEREKRNQIATRANKTIENCGLDAAKASLFFVEAMDIDTEELGYAEKETTRGQRRRAAGGLAGFSSRV